MPSFQALLILWESLASERQEVRDTRLPVTSAYLHTLLVGSASCLSFFLCWWHCAEGLVGRSGDVHCCFFSGVFIEISCALCGV